MFKIFEARFQDDLHGKSNAYKFMFGGTRHKKLAMGNSNRVVNPRKVSAESTSVRSYPEWFSNTPASEHVQNDDISFGNANPDDKLFNLNASQEFSLFKNETDFNPDASFLCYENQLICNDDVDQCLKNTHNSDPNGSVNDEACIVLADVGQEAINSEIFIETLSNKGDRHPKCHEQASANKILPLTCQKSNKSSNDCPVSVKQVGANHRSKNSRKYNFGLRSRHSSTKRNNSISNMADSKSTVFKWNWFSLGRTCFRGMSNYYKDKFEPILKEWTKKELSIRPPMDDIITNFIKIEFKFNEVFYQSSRFQSFLDCMATVLHSQNYKKKDDYIVRREFFAIRNLLYWYSSNAKKTFLSNKNYAYIFNNFYNKAADSLMENKTKEKPEQFKIELSHEMEDINKLAIKTITDM